MSETVNNTGSKSSARPALKPIHSDHFSSEEVQQIIALAMQQAEFSNRAQIEDIAQELSIEKSAIANAIEIWQAQKLKSQKQQHRRQQFYKYELLPYIVVNAFLIWLNLSISGTLSWAIYPLMGWGTAVLISFLSGSTGCFHRRFAEQSALGRSVGAR